MDTIITVILILAVLYNTKDTIQKFLNSKYSSNIFKKSESDVKGEVQSNRINAFVFTLGILLIQNNNLRFVILTLLTAYIFVLLNSLNILSYIKSKEHSIIKHSIIFNVLLAVFYFAIIFFRSI